MIPNEWARGLEKKDSAGTATKTQDAFGESRRQRSRKELCGSNCELQTGKTAKKIDPAEREG